MKRKFLTGVLSVLLYFTVALSMISVTYAWLCYGKGVDLNVKGTAIANYFHSGTGTENDPYILTTPRHVYNLAWLQYLGTFNDITDGKLNAQVYFELGGNINMADGADTGYQTIPPIGTSEYPFLGNFDGKGFNISNAIVANKIGSDGLVAHPPVIDDVRYSEIIGFFGIVGDYTGAVELTSTQLKALEVKNLTLTDVTIKTSTTKSLAGLFAGYVNGNVSNINVVSGDITVNSGVLPYTETLTETNIINNTLSMSKYALIGDYHTTRINWVGGPGSVTTDQDQNIGWGGSINMLSLAQRVTYMMAVGTTATSSTPTSTVSSNNNFYGRTDSGRFDLEGANGQKFHFEDKTYLPLNIDMSTLSSGNYTSSSSETVHENNTGYLVGKYNQTTDMGYYSPAIISRAMGQLCNSIQGSQSSWSSLTYTENTTTELQILTKSVNGTYYVIGDDHNGLDSTKTPYSVYNNAGISVLTYSQLNFTQYDDSTPNQVREKLETMLLESSDHIYGIQIARLAPDLNVNDRYSSRSGVLELSTPVQLGETSVNSLVKGTIHFSLQTKGVITLVAATLPTHADYVTGEKNGINTVYPGNYSLPKLYKVERDPSTGKITALNVINVIAKDSDGNFSYHDSVEAANGKTIVFNYATMGTLTTSNNSYKAYMESLYYFEIPVGDGEFVLGGNGNASSAYLLYLDIGANAGEDLEENPDDGDGNGGTGTPEDSDEKGTIEGVAFAYKSGNLYVQITKTVKDGNNQDVAIVVTFDFSLKDKSSNAHTGATAKFTGTAPTGSSAASVTTSNNNTGQFTITENDTGSG